MAQVTYPLDDIEYLAENAQIYTCTRTSGVYTNGHFNANVTGDNTKVRVNDGLAWLKIAKYKGVAFLSDAMVELDLGLADANFTRIDGIFIQFTTAKNGTEIVFKKGTPASSPVAPAPIQTESIYELRLFSITRPVGSTVIRSQDIVDDRLDPTVCGLMRDGVTEIDTTVINNQFQEFLQTLVSAYETAIDETLAGEILNKLIKDKGKLTIPSTAVWVQLTSSTASAEELENDPELTNSWYTDVLFNCTENDYIELQPNVPTGGLGLAFYNRSMVNAIRLYAGVNLTGNELKFMVVSKRKRNEVV